MRSPKEVAIEVVNRGGLLVTGPMPVTIAREAMREALNDLDMAVSTIGQRRSHLHADDIRRMIHERLHALEEDDDPR